MTSTTVLLVCQALLSFAAAMLILRGMSIFVALMELQQQGKWTGMFSQLVSTAMACWFGAICLLYLGYRLAVIINLMRIN